MNEIVRAHVVVSGRVQGVFFRYATSEEALERGIAGWVRNIAGGKVEAVFEGPRQRVEDMIAWCAHGPPTASVSGVEVEWEAPAGETGFSVR